MQKKQLILLFSSLFSLNTALAFEPFVVETIKLEGLQRISEGTVYNYLPVEVGEVVAETDTHAILRELYKTGFFSQISLLRDDHVLVVKVVERPAIGSIQIKGNKDIKTDDLNKGLKDAGLQEGRTYQPATLKQITQSLQRQYYNYGKYAVNIEASVKEEERNRVSILIDITEGKPARIKDINFVGNRVFTNKKLSKEMQLTTPTLFSWFNNSDQYVKQKLAGDTETIRSYYLDRGYLQFNLDSTQVAITPDKESIYLTLNMKEGEQFTVHAVDLVGNTVVPKEELIDLLSIHSGDIFSRQKVVESSQAISDRLGEEGYAFADVDPDPIPVEGKENLVDLHFKVQPGNRYYARHIVFRGNGKTKDEVLRREMVQLEGAWVSSKKIKDGQTQLNRTGYFKNVQVDIQPVAGLADQVDIIYTVEEASSGQMTGGIGYSDVDGLLFQFSVSNRNFLGSGNNVDFNFNNSAAVTNYSVGYYNPYYTTNGISRGFNFYYKETDLSKTTNISSYTTDNYGGNVNYGFPISSRSRFELGGGYQTTKLAIDERFSPQEIIGFVNSNGSDYSEYTLSAGYRYNNLDRYLFPEKGVQFGVSGMGAVPGSDIQYYRFNADAESFYPLGHDFIFTLSGRLGYGEGYGKTEGLPFYKHYFAGGARSVRGFSESSLGPKDSNARPFGGNFLALSTASIVLPNPFTEGQSSARASLFVDAGQVYNTRGTYRNAAGNGVNINNPSGFRAATGVSLTWISPLAPLVFSYAVPLIKEPGDDTQAFTFTFGTYF